MNELVNEKKNILWKLMASLARPCKENLMEFSSVYSSYVKERWFQSGGCSSNKRKRNRRKKNMRAETSCEYVNRLLTFIDGNFYIIKCVVFIKNRLIGFPSIIINACFDGSILSKLDFFSHWTNENWRWRRFRWSQRNRIKRSKIALGIIYF